jgi:hypothetical protein
MFKQIFLVTAISFQFILIANAQHCPWDGADIMVICIKASPSDTVSINNLKVTVTDSTGNPCFYPYFFNGKEDSVRMIAFQNVIDPDCIPNRIPKTKDIRCYWFAKSNYVIASACYMFGVKGIQIIIEDIDGDANGGFFEKKVVPLDKQFAYHLCTNYSNWNYGPKGGFVDNFRTFDIILRKQ